MENKWNTSIEDLLRIWRILAEIGRTKSANASRTNWILHWGMLIPANIFGALTAISLLLNYSNINMAFHLSITTLGLIFSILSGVLHMIVSILQLNKNAEKHKYVVGKYHEIENYISMQLSLETKLRQDAEVMLTELKFAFADVDREKPAIFFKKLNNSTIDLDIAQELISHTKFHDEQVKQTFQNNLDNLDSLEELGESNELTSIEDFENYNNNNNLKCSSNYCIDKKIEKEFSKMKKEIKPILERADTKLSEINKYSR